MFVAIGIFCYAHSTFDEKGKNFDKGKWNMLPSRYNIVAGYIASSVVKTLQRNHGKAICLLDGVVEKCGLVYTQTWWYCTNIITTKSRLNKHCQCDKLIGLTPGRNVMKVGKTFQPGLLSTCEGGFQGTLMVLLDTMGRFYNRNSLTPSSS